MVAALISACGSTPVTLRETINVRTQDWALLSSNDQGDFYINEVSIKSAGKYMQAATRYAQRNASQIEGKNYLSSVTLAYFNCRYASYAPKEIIYYADFASKSESVYVEHYDDDELKFIIPNPKGNGAAILKRACRGK